MRQAVQTSQSNIHYELFDDFKFQDCLGEGFALEDYMTVQKLWYDNELAQLEIVCSSAIITASAKIYVNDALIDDLIHQIEQFINGEAEEGYWENEEKGDHSTTCVSLRFLSKDKLGHVFVEVYMELDDGGDYSRHNCCFYLNTEIGLLEQFCRKLSLLKQKTSDVQICLNREC